MERFDIAQGIRDSRAVDYGAKFGHAQGWGAVEHSTLAQPCSLQARELVKALDTLGVPQPEPPIRVPDHMTVQDLASARNFGQRSTRQLFALIRRPFSKGYGAQARLLRPG